MGVKRGFKELVDEALQVRTPHATIAKRLASTRAQLYMDAFGSFASIDAWSFSTIWQVWTGISELSLP